MFTILKGKKNTHPSIHNFQFFFLLLSSWKPISSQTKKSFSLSRPHFFLRDGLLLGDWWVFPPSPGVTNPPTVLRGSKLPLLHSFGGHVTECSNLRCRGFFLRKAPVETRVVYFKKKTCPYKKSLRCEGFFLLGVNKGLLTTYIYIYSIVLLAFESIGTAIKGKWYNVYVILERERERLPEFYVIYRNDEMYRVATHCPLLPTWIAWSLWEDSWISWTKIRG